MALPQYFLDQIEIQYGSSLAQEIIAGMQSRRVSLRANTLKTSQDAVAKELQQHGIAYRKPAFYQDAFLLESAQEEDVRMLPIYASGEIYLQSLSSMLPPLSLDPKENEDILDMAAAPGSKTTQMAALTHNKASITACEVNKIRADRLRHNLAMQGASRVSVMVQDARKLEDFFRFDRILLDAPCSGSGTMLAADENRAFSQKLVENSAMLQKQLLKKAWSLLKKGGTLVYSTCSILAKENEQVLSSLKGAAVSPLDMNMAGIHLLPTSLKGAVCVAPTQDFEGFFMARLVKT